MSGLPTLRTFAIGIALLLAVASCAPGSSGPASAPRAGGEQPQQPARTKHVAAAMMGEPTALVDRMNSTQITVPVVWTAPYIDADTMFTGAFASPLPKHLLEEAYLRDKQGFLALPYWSQEFVGTGPFKLRQFNPGTSVALEANADYALGRPKI